MMVIVVVVVCDSDNSCRVWGLESFEFGYLPKGQTFEDVEFGDRIERILYRA